VIKIVLITIAATRIFLYVTWNSIFLTSQKVDSWHHMYTGAILIVLSLALSKRCRVIGIGVGLGLFLDEFIHLFHILGITKTTDYWSSKSIIATTIGVIISAIVIRFVKLKKITS